MSGFLRGLSMVATTFSFLCLGLALHPLTEAARVPVALMTAALLGVGSNAALWASLAFPESK